jgi:tellurite resistance protein
MSQSVSPQTALIYLMVTTSAADSNMTDRELMTMGDMVRMLPVFKGFDPESIVSVAEECATLLDTDDGLDQVLDMVANSLAARLHETAYAICCDIVAADGNADQEELRILEMVQHRLDVDRLAAAGIERGARARHMKL